MTLRPELQPKEVDPTLLKRLTQLADAIDGGEEEECREMVSEFNSLSETNHRFLDFQGIYGGEGHEEWVYRLLVLKSIVPQQDITKSELTEIVRLVLLDEDGYLEILDNNVSYPFVSDLIYYPSNFPEFENEEPTEEEIVEFLLTYKKTKLSKSEQVRLLDKHLNQELSSFEFRQLSENLVGFELNSLRCWLNLHSFRASEAIELIHSGELVSDYAATISLKRCV
ncbi:hypothetical protein H7696_07400 [Vibrio alginolyticus]|uniref:hypothetical protein n=1 Tax=Vibrio TaxID=662 RepID=UPI001645CA5D|nr:MULTISPECIES: hypothetical protein [Vibrio]EGQ9765654.1 hypothetical protein [Vibrio alginolyticus]MCC9653951.1 hypothetical protein [Vibrio sp. MA64]MDW2143524.1 hypothetical protein [Vibrio sp. 1833]QNI28191.1 hypothetical protein H7696_07400 [Vibrio alginolyticus]